MLFGHFCCKKIFNDLSRNFEKCALNTSKAKIISYLATQETTTDHIYYRPDYNSFSLFFLHIVFEECHVDNTVVITYFSFCSISCFTCESTILRGIDNTDK